MRRLSVSYAGKTLGGFIQNIVWHGQYGEFDL